MVLKYFGKNEVCLWYASNLHDVAYTKILPARVLLVWCYCVSSLTFSKHWNDEPSRSLRY